MAYKSLNGKIYSSGPKYAGAARGIPQIGIPKNAMASKPTGPGFGSSVGSGLVQGAKAGAGGNVYGMIGGAAAGALYGAAQYAATPRSTSQYSQQYSAANRGMVDVSRTTTQSPIGKAASWLTGGAIGGGTSTLSMGNMQPSGFSPVQSASSGFGIKGTTSPSQYVKSDPNRSWGAGVTIGQGQGYDAYSKVNYYNPSNDPYSVSIGGDFGATNRMALKAANTRRLTGYKSLGGANIGGGISLSGKEQKSYRGVGKQDAEWLPEDNTFKMRKTISGPDYKMSEHSQAEKTGTIKTSEGTFAIEKRPEVSEEVKMSEATRPVREEEIKKESKARTFSKARARYARKHPAQRIKKQSLIQKMVGGVTGQITGGIQKIGNQYTGGAGLV